MSIKIVATNRKAYHNYLLSEPIEAGIALTGTEIKSIREGHASIADAYIRPEAGELWLVGAHIARYDPGSYMSHEPMRSRKLLLHRREITEYVSRMKEKGFTLVPVKLYIKGGLAKVEIALGRGKKLYDKREAIAKSDTDREIERAIKNRRLGR